MLKQIIQRNLPLNQKYVLTNKAYIPLLEGFGTCCANCGKLIANIATVKNEDGKSYEIGFDCLETILINNSLLSTGDVAAYEAAKKMIPKILNFSKKLKEIINLNPTITGFRFETPSKHFPEWITFYWISPKFRPYNDGVKIKEMDFNFLIETLKSIFPKLNLEVK